MIFFFFLNPSELPEFQYHTFGAHKSTMVIVENNLTLCQTIVFTRNADVLICSSYNNNNCCVYSAVIVVTNARKIVVPQKPFVSTVFGEWISNENNNAPREFLQITAVSSSYYPTKKSSFDKTLKKNFFSTHAPTFSAYMFTIAVHIYNRHRESSMKLI